METYPNAIQFAGDSEHDVLWVGLDAGKKELVGVAKDLLDANRAWPGQEYVGVELRDSANKLVQSARVEGDEHALPVAAKLRWAYQNGWVLVARHQEANARLTAYSDGTPLPRDAAKTQRFLIVNDHLVRDQAAITSPAPKQAKVGDAYQHQLTGTGTGTDAWSVSKGALPAGLTLNGTTGVISGTPTNAGSVTFTVQLSNSSGSATKEYTLVVEVKAPTITSKAPPAGKAREAYTHQFTASDGEGAVWKVESGKLPVGVTLDAKTGLLSGVPLRVGSSTFELSVTTPGGVAKASNTVVVAAGAPVSAKYGDRVQFDGISNHDVMTVVLDGGKVRGFAENDVASHPNFASNSYYVSVELRNKANHLLQTGVVKGDQSASAVAEAMNWAYSDGDVLVAWHQEAGARLTAYSGGKALPQDEAKTQRFLIQNNTLVRDQVAITSAAPKQAKVGDAYQHQLTGTGTGAAAWSVSEGALPTGLTLNGTTGVISGTPTKAGSVTFTVQLTNFAGTATVDYTLAVQAKTPTITSKAPPAGKAREAYSHQFTASDGEGATWKLESGKLPIGVTLDAKTGLLSGVPTRVGSSTFEVSVTTPGGVAKASNTVVVAAGAPVSAKYGDRVQFDGVDNHDVWTVVLDGGKVRGFAENDVPSNPEFASNSYYVSVELRNKANHLLQTGVVKGDQSASAVAEAMNWSYSDGDVLVAWHQEAATRLTAYSGGKALPQDEAKTQRFLIQNNTLVRDTVTITSPAPKQAKVGDAYQHQLTGTGTGTAAWSVSKGALPTGLTLNGTTGVIAGTPTKAGSVTFTAQLTNFAGTATVDYTLAVQAKTPTITSKAPSAGKAREAYTHQFTASDGEGATWKVESGKLPVGVTLDAKTGLLSGVPTRVGSSMFEVSVTTPGGVAKASNTVVVAAGAPVSAKYGDRVQFDGVDNHDVWTVVLDGGKVRGFAENDVPSNPEFASNSYYVSVELRNKANHLLQTGVVKGDQSASAIAEAMNWAYSDGDVLVAWHQEAGARLTAYSGGKALPQDEAKTQRFLIQNNTLVRDAVSITSAAPKQTKVGDAYRHQLTGTGTGAAAWSVSQGALPAGLTLNGKTGLISGTPTKAGSVTFTVQLTNFAGTATQEYTVFVASDKLPVITSGDLPQGRQGAAYTHQFTASNAEGGVWKFTPKVGVPGVLLDAATGLLSGVPTRTITTPVTVTLTTPTGTTTADYTLAVTSNVMDTYPNAVQFSGILDHDVLWVGLDAQKKELVGVATDTAMSHEYWPGDEYVALELRNGNDNLLQSTMVKGDEDALQVAARLNWEYREGWTLVLRHQEAASRLTVYSDGAPLPRDAAKTQRFRIVDDHLVREGVTSISTPANNSSIVERPTVTGSAVPGKTVQISAVIGFTTKVLGTAVTDADGRWVFATPAEKALPVGPVTLTATMTDHPAPSKPEVVVRVVKAPPASLTMKAWTQVVDTLRTRER